MLFLLKLIIVCYCLIQVNYSHWTIKIYLVEDDQFYQTYDSLYLDDYLIHQHLVFQTTIGQITLYTSYSSYLILVA